MTPKLALEIDALEVTSFDPGSPDAERGTVHGNAITDASCDPSCNLLQCESDACPVSGDPSCSKYCQPPTAVDCA